VLGNDAERDESLRKREAVMREYISTRKTEGGVAAIGDSRWKRGKNV
jgi:hypothetical protein